MKVVYIVEAHGVLCGCAVVQHFAIDAKLFTNWGRLRQECSEELKRSARFDALWCVHLYVSPRLTLMKKMNRRKFLRILNRVERW